MPKFDPKTLNGVHKLKNDNGEIDQLTCQYYDGVGAFYCIINNDPSSQAAVSVAQLKRVLKRYEVREAA
jgi:hypothetical protein